MLILTLEYINIKIWILQREKCKKKIMGLFTLLQPFGCKEVKLAVILGNNIILGYFFSQIKIIFHHLTNF